MSGKLRYKGCVLSNVKVGNEKVAQYHVPPCVVMPNTTAYELMTTKTDQQKKPGGIKMIDEHMFEMDVKWRKMEGRKPYDQLSEREKMLEGGIRWDPIRLKELTDAERAGLGSV